jgi:lipopolysaccharide/colanic/teichoic acid biosynthesis glycosyltransferase
MLKRVIDVVVAGLALIVALPVMAAVALAVFVSMGRPIFFTQARPGRGGQPFTIVKFRTMQLARGPGEDLLRDRDRLTGLGRFLRSTSLDELPELWNVLKGDMSLVGPRPLLMEYLPLYTPRQARRHEVRPGITGWAQINGRNTVSWDQRFEMDVWYVDNRTIWLDLRILARTMINVVRRDGITAEGSATMPRFRGQR